MHNRLIEYISKEKLIQNGKKVLLAVSGGMDSVVMCHLFSKTDIEFGIAHCNFELRGAESDGDAKFVEELAKNFKVPFYLNNCNAKNYAQEKSISIQMAARDLRFAWFEEFIRKEDYAVYATAHHLDDAIETYFINQLRGTGIAGLHGLLPINGKLIHPLLFTSRNEVVDYVQQNKISFREDSSNISTKYMRNSLRHKVLPVLEDIQPAYRDILEQNMHRFKAAESIFLQKVEEERQKICFSEENMLKLSISKLLSLDQASTYLYEFIKEYGYGFSQAEEIVESMKNGHAGSRFYADKNVLLRDRNELIITEYQDNTKEKVILDIDQERIDYPIDLKWEILNEARFESDLNNAFLDFDKLKFPLKLRKWEQGDAFYPLGMNKKKLLSDFFIDLKLNRFQKENTWLLLSGNDIAWVVSYRIDNRFRISEKTKKCLKFEFKH